MQGILLLISTSEKKTLYDQDQGGGRWQDPEVTRRARSLVVRSVPAVLIDGTLATCCAGRGPDEATLRWAYLQQPEA